MFSWRHPKRLPLIVAHRGSSDVAPENTLAAFRRAISDGADAVELDVRLTKDGEVVVIHDGTLDRTTDGHGRISKKTLQELQALSVGNWFGKKFSTERIPTLDEVFKLIDGRIGINIEAKADWRGKHDMTIIDRCCEIIKKHRAQQIVMISSFFTSFIERTRALQPQIVTGILYHPARHITRSPIALSQREHSACVILNRSRVRKGLVRNAHEHGIRVGEYTINTQRGLHRALRYGVDMIFTDNPLKMNKLLRQEK